MKHLRVIFQICVSVLVAIYVALIFALDNSRVQEFIADNVETQLEDLFGTNVEIGHINIGLFNSVEIHDVILKDKANKDLLNSKLIYGKIRISPLLKGKIYLRNISILDASITLYKEREGMPLNFQFIIDAFKSSSKEKKELDLSINSLLLRRCQISFDQYDKARYADNRFCPHHLLLNNVEANLSLKHLTNDSINLRVRQLKLAEQSGLKINNFRLSIQANEKEASLKDLLIKLPHSHIEQKLIKARYNAKDIKQLKHTLDLKAHCNDILLSTLDFEAFMPQLKGIDETLTLSSDVRFEHDKLNLQNIHISSLDNNLKFDGYFVSSSYDGIKQLSADVKALNINQKLLVKISESFNNNINHQYLSNIGDVYIKGNLSLKTDTIKTRAVPLAFAQFKGDIDTNAGVLNADISLLHDEIRAKLASNAISPITFYEKTFMPSQLDFTLALDSKISKQNKDKEGKLVISYATTDLLVNSVTINGNKYNDIRALGKLIDNKVGLQISSNDTRINLSGNGSAILDEKAPFKRIPHDIDINLRVNHLNTAHLTLPKQITDKNFSFTIAASIPSFKRNNILGNITIQDFSIDNNQFSIPYTLKHFNVNTYPTSKGNHISLRSDLANLDYNGPILPKYLKEIGTNIYNCIKNGKYDNNESVHEIGVADKAMSFALAVKDVEILNRLLNLNISKKGTINLEGFSTVDGRQLSLSLLVPDLSIGKFNVHDMSLYAHNREGSFNVLAKVGKKVKNGVLQAELTAINKDGRILTEIEWDESIQHKFYGKLSSVTTIELPADAPKSNSAEKITQDKDSRVSIHTEFLPTDICIGDSLWKFTKSSIEYANKQIKINNLGIHNERQSLLINGTYDRSTEDSITVDLKNVDLDYALAFVRLGVINFSGHVTGKAYVRQLEDGSPWAKAILNIPDFYFNHTEFGNADIVLAWDHKNKDILIHGDIEEPGISHTLVNGYVDPVNKDLDLYTESKNTQIGFINKYTEGIFSDIEGRVSGNCRIHGGFQSIEFDGHEFGNCQATIPVTGVTYRISNADVSVLPDAFVVNSAVIKDLHSGEGVASGSLSHKYLKNMCYDFRLSGKNLLLYDKPREIDMPFFAYALGSGNVHLYGGPGKMNADIKIQTVPGSELTYILDSPDADVSQLINFKEREVSSSNDSIINRPLYISEEPNTPSESAQSKANETPATTSNTDINLYFEVDVDNNSCLHMITDDKSGDIITVYGNGPIQATYHNKSGFQMFGTYNIDRGTYGLNIPMLAQRKKFDILSGGNVRFSGDPTTAEVDVKAQYVVNSASLADLNIGTGFANNTTKVNCLVNIIGEVANMQFELDFELPNCSEDEQQMVRNLIASDEDRIMQVLYLLGVGRFYAYNYASTEIGQSQSVLMMNSLLSSTLSSQLNNIIADAIGTSNWTFGTNISTGQLGWSDMEVEGLISSRLLNNRLLLNGNFGYSDRQYATTNFVGDFDMQYLITPKGTVSIRAYSETNDRYFTKSTLTTQGVGLQLKRDFTRITNLFRRRKNN